jgi:hypothetical protein
VGMFRGADAYVAHNADFERSFLGALLGAAHWVCHLQDRAVDLAGRSRIPTSLRYRPGFATIQRR